MTETPTPTSGRLANGRFGPGAPGRPPGARNRLSLKRMLSIMEEFEAGKRALTARIDAALAIESGRRGRRARIK